MHFSYTTKVAMFGNTAETLDISDFSIVPGDARHRALCRHAHDAARGQPARRRMAPAAGRGLRAHLPPTASQRARVRNADGARELGREGVLRAAVFQRELVAYLESKPERSRRAWGRLYAIGLFTSTPAGHLREFPCTLALRSALLPHTTMLRT